MERVICLIIGYIFGLFQTGYFYGKIHDTDIRQHGSGNAGTTNALRTFGFRGGVITFLGDFAKSIFAAALVSYIYQEQSPSYVSVLEMYAGFGAVLGHDFPFYLKFKGGKGIATTAGLMIVINTKLSLIAMLIFIVIALSTRYVSLASLLCMTTITAELIICGQLGYLPQQGNYLYEIYAITLVMAALAFYKHKMNIVKLINGTENKLDLKKHK